MEKDILCIQYFQREVYSIGSTYRYFSISIIKFSVNLSFLRNI